MRLPLFEFNDSTDYAIVEQAVKEAVVDIVARAGRKPEYYKFISNTLLIYLFAIDYNKGVNTVRYQDAVKSAYYALDNYNI